MAKRMDILKCGACGVVTEVLHEGECQLSCCGQPMKQFVENTTDASKEKHVPVMEKSNGGFKVKVGSIPHPMEEKHYIEWIEVTTQDGKAYRQFLKPGMSPEAMFDLKSQDVTVREYCNIHGLWKA